MVFFRKFFFKILLSSCIIAFLVICPFSLFAKINELNYSLNSEYKFDFSGVLELWNVDTFEGGSVSRTTFLEKRAIEFEKQNKGIFISVNNLTLEQLKLNLENGKKPHIITFGIGVGDIFLNDIINLSSSYLVRDDLTKSSKINGSLKALPIMIGGYSLISNSEKISNEKIIETLNENNQIIFSTIDNINPLLSLFVNDVKTEFLANESLSSFDAYDKFINSKYNVLLGTQRDFYRCRNRENNLKMQCNYNILSGFTDLIVYASIFKSSNQIEEIANSFLKYLTSESVQCKLCNINMFPVINKNIYTDSFYKKHNDELLKEMKTLNVFYSNETLENIKNLCIEYFTTEKIDKKEISKFLL